MPASPPSVRAPAAATLDAKGWHRDSGKTSATGKVFAKFYQTNAVDPEDAVAMKRAQEAMKEFAKHMRDCGHSTDGWEVGLLWNRKEGRFALKFFDPKGKRYTSLQSASRSLDVKDAHEL